jgi:hemerythrin-like domain-containing protein
MATATPMTERPTAPATTVLRREHQAILRMLDVLDRVAGKVESGEDVPQGMIEGLLEFFTIFNDRCHQGKEEECLFPRLEQKGLPRSGGPIAALVSEHVQSRALLARMRTVSPACADDPDSARRFAEAAHKYVALVREHISKENTVLFMMAERLLTDSEQRALAAEFDRIEDEKLSVGAHERVHTKLDILSADLLR